MIKQSQDQYDRSKSGLRGYQSTQRGSEEFNPGGEDSVLISDRIKRERARHHRHSRDFSTRDSIFGDQITDLAREFREGQEKKRAFEKSLFVMAGTSRISFNKMTRSQFAFP